MTTDTLSPDHPLSVSSVDPSSVTLRQRQGLPAIAFSGSSLPVQGIVNGKLHNVCYPSPFAVCQMVEDFDFEIDSRQFNQGNLFFRSRQIYLLLSIPREKGANTVDEVSV